MKPSERTAPPRDTATAASPGEDFIRDRSPGASPGEDFIRDIVRADLAAGRHSQVVTRFPPEPNGYPHIGHAKSICLNFGLPRDLGGYCNLRFDDSNPLTEDVEYVEAIQRDVRWLGFDWGDRLYFASDYFERLYELAELLVNKGLAYVDELSEEEIRAHRGTVTEAGRPSPYRDRPVEENLALLRRMREGELPDGAAVLRARIDMAAANMKMRDPLLYRIRHAEHYRRGDAWCIYPMYDFIHPLSDAIEGITHSLCTLEFENNRELYDWLLAAVDWPEPRPHQYEFARLNLNYTVMSKRKLLELVESRAGAGVGRPADADALRLAPPRLHAGVDPQLLRPRRRRQGAQHGRRGAARARRARGPQHQGAARALRAAAAQAGGRELAGGEGRDLRRPVLAARRAEGGVARTAVLARAVDRARRLR